MTELTTEQKLELMESHMRVSWDELDKILDRNTERTGGGSADTRNTIGPDWAKNKYPLFKMFGEKLVLSSEVENSITNSEIEESLSVFIEESTNSTELDVKTKLNVVSYFGSFNYVELNKNIIHEDKFVLGKKLNKGMKVSRGLKQVIADKKVLDEVQTAYSKFVQEIDASGTLELSIEPVDILMSSVNSDNRWRSCHNVFDGEYSAGAVAYTVDASTIIAQIYNKRDSDNIALKTWRQLIWVDTEQNLSVFSRQYPSVNKNNSRAVVELIKEEIYNEARHGFFDSCQIRDIMYDYGGCHYNDISHDHLNIVRGVTLSNVFDGTYGSVEDSHKNTLRPILSSYNSKNGKEVKFEVGIHNVPSLDDRSESLGGYDEGFTYYAAIEED